MEACRITMVYYLTSYYEIYEFYIAIIMYNKIIERQNVVSFWLYLWQYFIIEIISDNCKSEIDI